MTIYILNISIYISIYIEHKGLRTNITNIIFFIILFIFLEIFDKKNHKTFFTFLMNQFILIGKKLREQNNKIA